MRRLLPLVAAEWRMLWRSPGTWAAGLLGLVYGVGGAIRQETYLEVALNVGASLAVILPLALALVWITAAHRSERYEAADLVDSTPLSSVIRRSAETAGGLLVGLSIAGAVAGASILVYALLAPGGPRGIASDLWLLGLIAAPVLLAWISLSRLLARALAPGSAYLAATLIWAWGLWTRTQHLTLGYVPAEQYRSEAMLLGHAGGRELLAHRGALIALGIMLAVVASAPASRPRPKEGPKAVGVLLVLALAAGLLAVPGGLALLRIPPVPRHSETWVQLADSGDRWIAVRTTEGVAYVAPAYELWAEDALGAIGTLIAEERGSPGDLVLVVVPVAALDTHDSTILLPERTLVDAKSQTTLVRRLITQWVNHRLSRHEEDREQPLNQFDAHLREGIRLYLEWRYVADLLGRDVARAEAGAWSAAFVDRTSSRDVTSLFESRGVSAMSDIAVKVARSLWDELGDPPIERVLGAYPSMWSSLARQPAGLPPEQAVVRAMADAVRQQAGNAGP